MRVEIWSPDGIEASAIGALTEVRRADNLDAIGLMTSDHGARVWLAPEEVEWLRMQLVKLEVAA